MHLQSSFTLRRLSLLVVCFGLFALQGRAQECDGEYFGGGFVQGGSYSATVSQPGSAGMALAQSAILQAMGIVKPDCPECPKGDEEGCAPDVAYPTEAIDWSGPTQPPSGPGYEFTGTVAAGFRWYQVCGLCVAIPQH